MQRYKDGLATGFWRYVADRGDLSGTLDRSAPDSRPPVFTLENADLNVIRGPDARPEQEAELLGAIPRRHRHRWFRSMASSQALAQSLFGNLRVHDRIGALEGIVTDTGEPLLGATAEALELEVEVDHLGEPRKTSVDVLVRCANGYRVALECKLTESGVGTCSRPALRPCDPGYERDHCDGTYTRQRAREVRCSLTNIGVTYWKHIPSLFEWPSEHDHRPCPVHGTYQMVRNVLAVCVDGKGSSIPHEGHAVLIYDERNPAFVLNGDGYAAYERTRAALRQRSLLRRCSWQTIVQHLRRTGTLGWLADHLSAKYGF